MRIESILSRARFKPRLTDPPENASGGSRLKKLGWTGGEVLQGQGTRPGRSEQATPPSTASPHPPGPSTTAQGTQRWLANSMQRCSSQLPANHHNVRSRSSAQQSTAHAGRANSTLSPPKPNTRGGIEFPSSAATEENTLHHHTTSIPINRPRVESPKAPHPQNGLKSRLLGRLWYVLPPPSPPSFHQPTQPTTPPN
jgi:hypothetical protein